MDGYEFGAIGEGALDLHFVNHFRNAFHDILFLENGCVLPFIGWICSVLEQNSWCPFHFSIYRALVK